LKPQWQQRQQAKKLF